MYTMKALLAGALILPAVTAAKLRIIQYITEWHKTMPPSARTAPVTDVVKCCMNSTEFNRKPGNHTWTPITWQSVANTRLQFPETAKVLVAIGGWSDVVGFDIAARTEKSRPDWAANVASFVKDTGCDGIDIDREYPGGNGADYPGVPNEQKTWQIQAYPQLLAEVRRALGLDKLLTAAVPSKVGDMIAFTNETVPLIMKEVDYLNFMTYDLMNRRDTITKHHTGVKGSIEALDAYIRRGAKAEDLNLGLAYYVKWFKTKHEECEENPIGCPTVPLENPTTGDDLGTSGAFGWVEGLPEKHKDLTDSFQRARTEGEIDPNDGSYYYWDSQMDVWWTFDKPENIQSKFANIVELKKIGGVMAWELGNDGPGFERFAATNEGILATCKSTHAKKHLGAKRTL